MQHQAHKASSAMHIIPEDAHDNQHMMFEIFTTYELVEARLHHLPTKDLLLNQRVCRTWRDVIARSRKLQRALFLLPVAGGTLHDNWRFSEYLASLWAYKDSPVAMRVLRNPLLEPLHISIFADEERPAHRTYDYPEASWRKMLLSQPGTIVPDIWGIPLDSPAPEEATRAEQILGVAMVVPRRYGNTFTAGPNMGNSDFLRSNEEIEQLTMQEEIEDES